MSTTELPNFLIFLMFISIALYLLTSGKDLYEEITVKTVLNMVGTLGIIICVWWVALISLGWMTY